MESIGTGTRQAALYLRVSTGRQAEQDLSIPDQRRQLQVYCQAKGWEAVAEFTEPGASATDDRRPEFQRLMDAALAKPAPFDVIVVHSFSRFFRDQFLLEFYVRKLAKNHVRLVSVTQDLGDDPMSVMMRQIMALFDEYQSKENAKHTLRAMRENARQGFWNGSLPPYGYRTVEVEHRGARVKKRLEPDPIAADMVRRIFDLARLGDGEEGPMGSRQIADYLNERGVRTQIGRRWSGAGVHAVLTRSTYIGRHLFNVRSWRTKTTKPAEEVVEVAVPAIVDQETFDEVQALIRSRSPQLKAPRYVGGTTLLGGIVFCSACGGAMTLRATRKVYRYYTCSSRVRKGRFGCKGVTIPEAQLDESVVSALESKLLTEERLGQILGELVERRSAEARKSADRVVELRRQAMEADGRLRRLYDAIETGSVDPTETGLKDQIRELTSIRDAMQADADRAAGRGSNEIRLSDAMVRDFAREARARLRRKNGGFRRHFVEAFAQRIEVTRDEIRIRGSTGPLVRTLAQMGQASPGVFASASKVRVFDPKWLPR